MTKILQTGNINEITRYTSAVLHHVHSYERWLELAGTPSGETHRADNAGLGAGSFQIDADNDDWGAWVQLIGSEDTPVQTDKLYFDLRRMLVTGTERNEIYVIQLAFGASGADALTSGDYTELVFIPSGFFADTGPVEIQCKRQAVGTKVWARCICPGQDTGTFDFMIGLHEYDT